MKVERLAFSCSNAKIFSATPTEGLISVFAFFVLAKAIYQQWRLH